jgi:Protein of unknown function (DUF2947)
MFETIESDYDEMDGYPFAWRWTGENHADISPEILERIKPLSEARARDAWDHALGLQGEFYKKRFSETDELEVDRTDVNDPENGVSAWLCSVLPASDEPVYISWTERMAARTERDVIVNHWNTFCYPVEDVVIWPQSESWVLLFDYKQRFFFAVGK